MPKVEQNGEKPPEKLRPYLFHGVDLRWRASDTHAMADCPLCGRVDKFGVEIRTGRFKCFKCLETGNSYVFLRWLWKESEEKTTDYDELSIERGLLFPETLVYWAVSRSIMTGNWLIPGYNPDGKLCQLYQYMSSRKGMRLLPTPTLGHQLHGMNLYRKDGADVYLCEGPWDAMVLWEMMSHSRYDDEEKLETTASNGKNLLREASVLAVPGCSTFFDSWISVFADKTVYLMYDNDHPREHPKTGKVVPPAGYSAMKRVAKILIESKTPPTAVWHLKWGSDGYDPELPSGTDVRDYLNA